MNRQQIVATKASCQVFGHGSKLLYFGALIEQAGSAEDALESIRGSLPDMVLLDVVFGPRDGRDLCRALRRSPQCRT